SRIVKRCVYTCDREGFGAALAQVMPVRDALLRYENIVVLASDARIDYSQEPAVWTALLGGERCVVSTDGAALIPLPRGRFATLITPGIEIGRAGRRCGGGVPACLDGYTQAG